MNHFTSYSDNSLFMRNGDICGEQQKNKNYEQHHFI